MFNQFDSLETQLLFEECTFEQEMLEEEALLEAFGLNVGLFNKDRLNDKDYVNTLIRRINDVDDIERDIIKIYGFLVKIETILLSITIIGIPAALIVNALGKLWVKVFNKLTTLASSSGHSSIVKVMGKAIDDLEKQKKEAKSNSEIKEIEATIQKLEKNKEAVVKAEKEFRERMSKKEDKKKK